MDGEHDGVTAREAVCEVILDIIESEFAPNSPLSHPELARISPSKFARTLPVLVISGPSSDRFLAISNPLSDRLLVIISTVAHTLAIGSWTTLDLTWESSTTAIQTSSRRATTKSRGGRGGSARTGSAWSRRSLVSPQTICCCL